MSERQRKAAREARRRDEAEQQATPQSADVRQPPLRLLGGVSNQAAARWVARLPQTTDRRLARFESLEHKTMGDTGSGDATMELAPGFNVSFGDVTALAGDYFGSLDEMQKLAKIPGATMAPYNKPGTVDEVKYALYVEVQKSMKADQFDEKVVNAAKKRYYNLAAKNVSHFSRPDMGDATATQLDLAAKGSANNAGSYRANHEKAIEEAVKAGTGMCRPLNQAMLQEGFASHFLTDAFSSGHIRTPRAFVGDWWNPRVPMFWHNLKLWLAENIAWHMNENSIAGYPLTVNFLSHQAISTLEEVMAAKSMPDLQFGDALSGALHDWDNEHGVMANVGTGAPVRLFGDGEVLDEKGRKLLQGHETFLLAAAAVKVSIKDVNDAYWAATKGNTDVAAVKASLKTPDQLYKAEQGFPRALPDAQQPDNPTQDWMVASVQELFQKPRMRAALTLFAHNKADTLGSEVELDPPLKEAKTDALKWALQKLKGDEASVMKVFEQIINYTPGAVTAAIAGDEQGEGDLTGLFGDTSDDNARDYFNKAKQTPGGLASLSADQRIRLIKLGLDGATTDDDEDMINGLLESNKSHIVPVVDVVGWRRIWDDIDGEECAKFIKIAGEAYWKTQSYSRKRDEVKHLADGRTGERSQELIIVILRTCTGAEVRRIDDEVGSVMGLSFDLDGIEQDQFDALKARP
jgi:hypothetical protein